MRKLLTLIVGLCAAGVLPGAQAATANPIAQFIGAYQKAYTDLGLGGEMELSYVKNIQNLLRHTDLARQQLATDTLSKRLETLDMGAADPCQQLQLRQIGFELALNRHKLDVLRQYRALGAQASVSDRGLAATTMGKQWYAYLRKAWLTMDTSPEALMAMGRVELDKAIARYASLQARMGYAGRDQDFAAYLNSGRFHYPDNATPQADYEARQAIIYKNLHKLFFATTIEPPLIRPSDLGASLPVDGYYEPDQATFFFNQSTPGYQRRNIDWLLLHESTPGHHYQGRYALAQRGCPVGLPHIFYSAFIEGWAAYVEEFGAQLGLFQSDTDALGAIEWDLVRSIRVVLDVGINHDGWSELQARQYWRDKLPMLPALAEREIARVRNWPAQAITYKLGSVMLRELRSAAQARQGASFDIRQFHDNVLKNGPVPLAILPQMLQQAEQQAAGTTGAH